MQFLKGDMTDLLKYARNVNSHFANKKCQDVIVAARNLMTSEIHNTVKVPVVTISCFPRWKNSVAGQEGLSRTVDVLFFFLFFFCRALATCDYLVILANNSFEVTFNSVQVGCFTTKMILNVFEAYFCRPFWRVS